jgi:hypothetical protein
MNELKSAVRRAAYEIDFAAWTSEQARRLRLSKPAGLDWENLAEEVESLGRSDKRAVGSALKIILEHLIKWRFQADKRSSSWSDSIDEHRDRISRILDDSPSLAALPGEILEQEYRRARRKALRDSRLPASSIPVACPFSVKQALDPDFWPEESSSSAARPKR